MASITYKTRVLKGVGMLARAPKKDLSIMNVDFIWKKVIHLSYKDTNISREALL